MLIIAGYYFIGIHEHIQIYASGTEIVSLFYGPLAVRFQEVVRKSVEAGKKEGLSAEFITKVLNAIHEESLCVEESLK